MKRSQINRVMDRARLFIRECGFHLPPFANWRPKDWSTKGPECDEIRLSRLGWDITDFGKGDFERIGLLLFTIRNGTPEGAAAGGKSYAEKVMIVEEGQVTPCHFHWMKQEDIINRGGADLMIQLWASDEAEEIIDDPVDVQVDGTTRRVDSGGIVRLEPGESITLDRGVYHKFWAEGGRCLIGEVSSVNDDTSDNRFLDPLPRFSEIEEDEEPLHYLCNEYPPAYSS